MTPPSLFTELDDFIAAFEQARDEDARAPIADFLPPGDHSFYLPVLRELVRVDMELAWRAGAPTRLHDYLRAYPVLGQDLATLGEIAYEEYRLRLVAGEQPTPVEYADRFGVSTTGWYTPTASSRPTPIPATQVLARPYPYVESAKKDFSIGPDVGTSDDFPAVGDVVAGFKVVGELGRGSFGRVYLAEQEQLAGRPVALKLSPSSFVGEAHTLARLQHTHIVPIYSLHRAGGRVAICMPYLGGKTLADLLRDLRHEAQMPTSGQWMLDRLGEVAIAGPARDRLAKGSYVDAVLWLVARLAEGLAHAHERGIVHRDLKPANVLLTADGTPMLLDFNLAQEYAAAAALAGGTLPYMAPEYLSRLGRDTPKSEPRHDVYALGLILWEMLAGEFPHPRREGGVGEVLPAMIADRRVMPQGLRRANPEVSASVEAIARRCLEPTPEMRYQSATDLRDDIDRHLANLPLAHASEPWAGRWRKWRRRHPRLMSATPVTALALLLVVGMATWQASRERSRGPLEARSAAAELRRDVEGLSFLLGSPDADPALLQEGLHRVIEQSNRYDALSENWRDGRLVRYLPPAEREDLVATMGEMLWMWGRVQGWHARSREDRDGARRVLRFAAACYSPGAVPPVLDRELARLGRLDGQVVQVKERSPATPREHYLDLLDQLGHRRYREALPLLRQVALRDTGSPTSWLLLARAYGELGNFDQAREFGNMALDAAPDWPWAWYHQGLMYLTAKQFDEARRCFDKFLELRPGVVEGRINRAIAWIQFGEPAKAIPDLDMAIEMDSPPTRVYFLRAEARMKMRDLDAARADHAEGMKREPADEISWVVRAVQWLPAEPAKALADLERALAINPDSPQALQNKAHVLSEYMKRLADAITCLDRLLQIRPDDRLALGGRAVLLARSGKRAEAHIDAKRLVTLSRDADITYQAACVFALTAGKHKEDSAEAVRLLRLAFQGDGKWIEVAERDPDLDALRGQEAFRDLLKRAKAWFQPAQ